MAHSHISCKTAPEITPERGQMTQQELVALADATAHSLLGVSAAEAFAKLERGELEGTLAGSSLTSLCWLLAD